TRRATCAGPTRHAGARWPRPSGVFPLRLLRAGDRLSCRVLGAPVLDEGGVLDLVEKSPIADAEELGGADPVPVSLLEGVEDGLALGGQGGLARDVLEGDPRLGRQESGLALAVPTIAPLALPRAVRQLGIAEDDHALDDVLELPDIARIPVARHPLERVVAQAEAIAPEQLRVATHEVLGEEGDLFRALAQGG